MARRGKNIKKGDDKNVAKKTFLISLGVGAAVVGGILLSGKAFGRSRSSEQNTTSEGDTNIYVLPASSSATKSNAKGGNDSFPLRYGSVGLRVSQLQEALKRILGAEVLAKYTKVDGDFRTGTQNALKAAGLPISIDEATFNRLTSGGTSLPDVFSPDALAAKLLAFAQGKNFDGVMGILKQLKSTNDYSAVNEPFKSKQWGAAQSIVTYLLDTSFSNNTKAKEEVKAEFKRIGLKETSGKWSLSGIRSYNDIITLVNTYVIDSYNRKIMVRKNTVLGEEIKVANGITYFMDLNQQIHTVPTRDVAYTK